MAKSKSKKTETVEVIEIDDIEVAGPVVTEYVTTEIIVARQLEKELAQFDAYEKRIAELREQYSGLVIEGVSDVDGQAKVREAIAELRTLRVSTDAERKQAKAPFIQAGKSIEEKAQWIISEIEKIELP